MQERRLTSASGCRGWADKRASASEAAAPRARVVVWWEKKGRARQYAETHTFGELVLKARAKVVRYGKDVVVTVRTRPKGMALSNVPNRRLCQPPTSPGGRVFRRLRLKPRAAAAQKGGESRTTKGRWAGYAPSGGPETGAYHGSTPARRKNVHIMYTGT